MAECYVLSEDELRGFPANSVSALLERLDLQDFLPPLDVWPDGLAGFEKLVEAQMHRAASEIDLRMELHLLARIERALAEMQGRDSYTMPLEMPSFDPVLVDRGVNIQMTQALRDLNQHLLDCATQTRQESLQLAAQDAVITLPSHMGDMCNDEFIASIRRALLTAIVIRLTHSAMIGYGEAITKEKRELIRKLERQETKKYCESHELTSKLFREYDMAAAKAEGDSTGRNNRNRAPFPTLENVGNSRTVVSNNHEMVESNVLTEDELRSFPAMCVSALLERVDLQYFVPPLDVWTDGLTGFEKLFEAQMHRAASEIDLRIELHLLARIEHALAEMGRDSCSMPLKMPSSSPVLLDRGGSIQMTQALSDLNQHLLDCATQTQQKLSHTHIKELVQLATQDAVITLPSDMGDMCNDEFIALIRRALLTAVATRLANSVIIGYGEAITKEKRELIRRLERQEAKNYCESHELTSKLFREYDVAAAKAEGDRVRAEFLAEAGLEPPQVLRMIDCKGSCEKKQVLLRDWADCVQELGYVAISHTYGQEAYGAFDCPCASICISKVPRCFCGPCPHDPAAANAANAMQSRVVQEILNMCDILRVAGVDYAWHDGVCIAQHDDTEVTETIEHIGWIYSNAKETIVFLHYVGKPMAPIRHGNAQDELTCRWHTRVWTLQEAALSKRRRYCVRVGTSPIGHCKSFEEFEMMVALWYDDDFSRVEVIEEERFYKMLNEIDFILHSLYIEFEMTVTRYNGEDDLAFDTASKARGWIKCIGGLLDTLKSVCFSFPTIDTALKLCSERKSKYEGDRMNSILTLAKVKGFVAPKKASVEASTVEFFRRQGQQGLSRAVFSINTFKDRDQDGEHLEEMRRHTWLPVLGTSFLSVYKDGLENLLRFEVLGDGRMELRGDLACMEVRFLVKLSLGEVGQLPIEGSLMLLEENANQEHSGSLVDSSPHRVNELIDVLNCLQASHNMAFVAMDLVHESMLTKHVRCALSESPAYSAGTVYIPVMDGPFTRICPTIDGHTPLQNGETFTAYLVLPWGDLDLMLSGLNHMLLVQGNIHGEVSKIGLFRPTTLLLKYIGKILDCPAITILESLVII